MTAWLHIVGIGEDGVAGLSAAARTALERAEIIIGGDRHQRLAPGIAAERRTWPHPFDALIGEIRALKGRRLAILATGDPLWYSVGARIGRAIPPEDIVYHPQISAFQWAACRMGWSLADIETLTAHGRPTAQIVPYFWPGARLLVLTAGAETPGETARLLAARGYGAARLTVLGHLGGPDETRHTGTAQTWAETDPAPGLPAFNTLAVDCQGSPAPPLGRCPGLPDSAFAHDGMLTKQDIRAVTLARLMPARGERLWDVGTGCGSIAIEWMRAGRDATAIGIDRSPARLALARQNAETLGTPKLELIEGDVPGALTGLPPPQAVFFGGGLGDAAIGQALAALPSGGRLVANAVTIQSETLLARMQARHGGDLVRLAVQRLEPVGSRQGWRPAMPVTQWSLIKP